MEMIVEKWKGNKFRGVATKNGHRGHEIKLKETAERYIRESLENLPKDWIK